MEAVKRKQPRRQKKRASVASDVAAEWVASTGSSEIWRDDAVVMRDDDMWALEKEVAEGAQDEELPWSRPSGQQGGGSATSAGAASDPTVVADKLREDDEILQHEEDIMALLEGDDEEEKMNDPSAPCEVVASDCSTAKPQESASAKDGGESPSLAAQGREDGESLTSKLTDTSQNHNAGLEGAKKLDCDNSGLLPSTGKPQVHNFGDLTAMAAPSAPNFDDSDDEDMAALFMNTVSDNSEATSRGSIDPTSHVATGDQVIPLPPSDNFSKQDTATTPSASLPIDPSLSSQRIPTTATPTAPMENEPPPTIVSNVTSREVASAPDFEMDETHVDLSADIERKAMIASAPPISPVVSSHGGSIESVSTDINPSKPHSPQSQSAQVTSGQDSVEKNAGKAVRNSFAKMSHVDPGERLYPSVLRSIGKGSLESGAAISKARASDEKLDSSPPTIFIKLEPYSNFEINLLRATASQKRQEAKMHSIAINKGELFSHLERYLYAEYLLHTASSSLDSRKKEIDMLVQKVWTIEMKRLSATKKCGDQIEIEEFLEFQTAKYEAHQLAKLKSHLEKLRQLRTVEASLYTFDRALSYFQVERYLNEVLQTPELVSHLNKKSSTGAISQSVSNGLGEFETMAATTSFYEPLPSGSTLLGTVDHLKYCIDVLIFFEKQVTVDERGLFGRVPPSFSRGELVWQAQNGRSNMTSGMERKIRCYGCGSQNSPLDPIQWCKFCESCGVLLYLPPSSVSTKTTEWYTSTLRFRQSLQKWISLCLRNILRLRSLTNMPYLLMHIMYLPRISTEERSWVLRFLQFPKAIITTTGEVKQEWSEDLVDHYLAMVHLVFHPEKLRRLTMLVSSESSVGRKDASKTSANGRDGKVSPEWVLLENPETLDRCFLSDEDFVEVLNQFPNAFAFEQLFRCSLDAKKCFSRALALVIEFTHGLRLFQEFEKFPARVAQLLTDVLTNASLVSAASSSTTTEGEAIFYPTLFDQLFLTALHGLLVADCNRVAWRSIRHFPFAPLSDLAKWDVLALLLYGVDHVPNDVKNAASWVKFIEKSSRRSDCEEERIPARNALHRQIVTDTDNAMHLLHAVARLAASCSSSIQSGNDINDREDSCRRDLVLVTTQELFLAGFANAECRQALGESGERAAGPISTICLAHPWVLSELISLLFKYHECTETWIHVFERFPVNRWLPTPSDLNSLQTWLLLDDPSAPRSVLARFLLDRINWEFDLKAERLFTNAYLHRQVALMIAEALVTYRNRRHNKARNYGDVGVSPPKLKSITKSLQLAFRLVSVVDLEQWCWKLMLKLKFYSPLTREPFVHLIDLKTDRSKEALLLRRWFPGAVSTNGLTFGGATIPFYASLDQLVRNITRKNNDSSDNLDHAFKMALAGTGSSGSPIQEEHIGGVINVENDQRENGKTEGHDEIETTVAVLSTCDVEPIVAYLVCQMTTFVFTDRMDRWEPMLVLFKNDLFQAGVKVLENVLPLMANLFRLLPGSASTDQRRSDISALNVSNDNPVQCGAVDHEVDVCMAAVETLSTDQMLIFLQAMQRYSYISVEERQLLSELLQNGYIGGWESSAKAKVLARLRFVRECSRYMHPLALPSMINESFPKSTASSISTTALVQGAMSWLASTIRGTNVDPPSPSSANSITSALSIRRSPLAATPPLTASNAVVTAAAAAASLGMLDTPSDYSGTTRSMCMMVERAFEHASASSLSAFAEFWMSALLQVPFWYEHPALRHAVDVLLRCSMQSWHFSSARTSTTQRERGKHLHIRLMSILHATFERYCRAIKHSTDDDLSGIGDAEQPYVISFLPVILSSAASLRSMFGAAADTAHYVEGCSVFSFWALLVETRQELPLFRAMGQLMVKYEPAAAKKIDKLSKTEHKVASELSAIGLSVAGSVNLHTCIMYAHTNYDSLGQYKIYRWCEYCLQLAEDEDVQILYWQVLFAQIFACSGGTHVFGHHFIDREDNEQGSTTDGLRKQLQTKLRRMTTYCSNQAQIVLTVSESTSRVTAEGKERKYHHYVKLSHIYTAMDTWLDDLDPNTWLKEDDFATLPRHFEVKWLKEVLVLSDQLLNTRSEDFRWENLLLWTNLCGFEFGLTSAVNVSSDGAIGEGTTLASQSALMDVALHEDDFAFVDESDEMRRHSSLGYSGDHGRCITPLALTPEYAGPVALSSLPHVTVTSQTDHCSIALSLPLNKSGLKTLAMKFSENLSILVGLDAEVLDHVSKLYSSKARVITESKPCLEGSNCRMPAAFRFEFTEWSMDNHLMDTVESTIAQSERYEMRSMVIGGVGSSLAEREYDDDLRHRGLMFDHTDQFLKLDADGLMLSMQILLIDELVLSLHREVEDAKRQVEVAKATTTKGIEGEQDENVQTMESRAERLHEKGLDWFRTLTELDTKLTRMVPPLREVLWRSIKQLGVTFVCIDERETCQLLQLMLDDPSRIMLLSECFSPSSAPSRFVEMFSNLMSNSSSSKLSTDEKLLLLRRFDFQAWLQTKPPHAPTKFDRDTVLTIVLGDMHSHSSNGDISTARGYRNGSSKQSAGKRNGGSGSDVLRVYAQILHQICVAHLGDHLEKVLHALVGVHDDYRFGGGVSNCSMDGDDREGSSTNESSLTSLPQPASAVMWEAVVTIPSSAWQLIPVVQVDACVSFMSQHMTTLRWQGATHASEGNHANQYPIGIWQRSGVLKISLDLFSLLWRSSPEEHKWPMLTSLFEPLLSTLYQPSTTTSNSSVCSPWSEEDSLSTGMTLCSCFVAVATEYLKTKPTPTRHPSHSKLSGDEEPRFVSVKAKLDLMWSFYVNTLIPNAPVYVCKNFHQFLTRLGWEKWCLTLEIVQQMRELVLTEKQQCQQQHEQHRMAGKPTSETNQSAGSSYPFVSWMIRDILCRMAWKATEEWLGTQNETIRSVFLCELAKLCVDLVLDFPHFQPQQPRVQRGRNGTSSSSSNVLPPYFINFIKQQPAFWSKWRINESELNSLLDFTLHAVMEPLTASSAHRDDDNIGATFPPNPSIGILQDAFTRLQLVFRLMCQITTLHHTAISKQESLKRVNQLLRTVYRIYEGGMHRGTSEYSITDRSSWQLVLFGATCTVLYEKLDEIVQVCRIGTVSNGAGSSGTNLSSSPSKILTEEDLLSTVIEILRLYNLRVVESFFQKEAPRQDSSPSSGVLTWGKCGNVIFVEVDSLMREFATTHKSFGTTTTSSSPPASSAEVLTSDEDDSVPGSGGLLSSPAYGMGRPLGRLLWSFLGFRGGELCSLAACGRAIASVSVMSLVAERNIEKWVIEERHGGWDELVARLKVPELSEEEFEGACLQHGNLLTVQVLFLQQLRKAPVMTESFAMGMLAKLMEWMEKMHQIRTTSARTEMKILFFAAEATHFIHKVLVDVLPAAHKKQSLRDLCNVMLRFGNARRQHGIMKAIGIGGSLKYNVEFHVCSLTIGVFLRLQTRNGAPLRVDERIPFKLTRTTEKHLKSLEHLLASKHCFQLQKRMEWMVDFLRSPSRSLADQDEFFVSLFSRIYPSHSWLLAKCITTPPPPSAPSEES